MIYLDEQFIAHPDQDKATTRMPWEDTDCFFTGKCAAFIEGHRVVPEGETWTREDGETFTGLMIAPVVNPTELVAAQAEHDKQTIAILDAEVVELTYENILLELAI